MSSEYKDRFNAASLDLKKLDYDNDIDILMGGDGVSNRMSLQVFLVRHRLSQEKDHDDVMAYLLNLSQKQMLAYIHEAQAQILRAVQRMDELINLADQRIIHLHENLQLLTHRHRTLNDTIEARYFDRNVDGTYKSAVVGETVAAFEQRTGEDISNDLSPDALIRILRAQQDFERKTLIPALENDLVILTEFRDDAQEQADIFKDENTGIDEAITSIDKDASLTDEQRCKRIASLILQSSDAALTAQTAADEKEAIYQKIQAELTNPSQDQRNTIYLEHSNTETAELLQSAEDNLQTIKPLLPSRP